MPRLTKDQAVAAAKTLAADVRESKTSRPPSEPHKVSEPDWMKPPKNRAKPRRCALPAGVDGDRSLVVDNLNCVHGCVRIAVEVKVGDKWQVLDGQNEVFLKRNEVPYLIDLLSRIPWGAASHT